MSGRVILGAVLGAVVVGAGVLASGATAQVDVGENAYGGLHWHVAAPKGASWALACRFRPVTMAVNRWERKRFSNVSTRSGAGAMAGRLPGDNGRCTLTKSGGAGPVGLAIVKAGAARAAGTNDPARPAIVDVF